MNLSTLMNAQLDMRLPAEALELRLSPVMYGWFVDQMRERGEAQRGVPPRWNFNGSTVELDAKQEGFRFAVRRPDIERYIKVLEDGHFDVTDKHIVEHITRYAMELEAREKAWRLAQ